MMRFMPDGWLEGLLRPFVLAEPLGGIYFEVAAPDWRFAALLVFLTLGVLTLRIPQRLAPVQRHALLALLLLIYVWTFTTGNGRYFVAGLLMVGPALVLSVRVLPGSAALRALLLAAVAAAQFVAIAQFYRPSRWGLVEWVDGPGLPIEESPLRQSPAVFLTVDTLSFSLLIPRFHPEARWANIAGQRRISPTMWEHARLQQMIASGLPMFLVAPENVNLMTADLQPNKALRQFFASLLGPHGLALRSTACQTVPSLLKPQQTSEQLVIPRLQGFWFCAVDKSDAAAGVSFKPELAPNDLDEIFAAVENRCPDFFPPGGGNAIYSDSYSSRHYPSSDMRLFVEYKGRVLHRYFRAINPTVIGSVDQVRRGDFELDCTNLPGRYRLPWQRD